LRTVTQRAGLIDAVIEDKYGAAALS